jgi:hypothetical protein
MGNDDPGPLTQREPAVRTKVVGKGGTTVDAMAVGGQPGTCAACRRPFHKHTDAELRACAASFTLDAGEDAP